MAGFWMGNQNQEQMNLWLTRSLVLLSFVAHLTLALLAGIRRSRHSGVMKFFVWLAYHVTEIGTPIALGKVFLDTANADSDQQLKVLVNTATAYREQQMFALWAPFLLLHLGRPDNITSYTLENKGLSLTQKVAVVLGIGGATYGSYYKQRFMRGDGALCAAFFIMLFLGSYKYVERAVALHRASFDNIRRSNERKELRCFTVEQEGRKWDNNDALLDAHGLLGVTMGAFAEYKVNPGGYRRSYSSWKDVSKVVEMEASLMYDMLYTKASVIHNWDGYMIRLVSPPATATAFYLFYHKEGMAMDSADRMVTYMLLVGTFWLDVRWLLRALGSTWTYVFLADTEHAEEEESKQVLLPVRRTISDNLPRPGWLKKAGCRRAVRQSWYWLRRLLVSLDPSQLSLRNGPSGHRLLSGLGVGQRNLLHECTTHRGRLEKITLSWAGPGRKKIDVKDELLEVMCRYLVVDLGIIVGMHPTRKLADYMRSNADSCSLQTSLIALHVATDIFLLCRPTLPGIESEESAKYEKSIRALSDYMMFLLAERRHMVLKPGDEGGGGHYKKARLDLEEIWGEEGTSGSHTTSDTKLANILLKMNATEGRCLTVHGQYSLLFERSKTLALGADWALKLLRQLDPATDYGRHQMQVEYDYKLENSIPAFTDEAETNIKWYRDHGEQSKLLDYMLQLILASWVRLLTFASYECSKDSHAKQLSCGGELLTIVWLMNQHGELDIISKRE